MRTRPSRTPDLPGREWRQFRLLVKDSWRRMLNGIVFARDADPVQFLLWGMALASTLPMITSVRKLVQYSMGQNAAPQALLRQVQFDRLFYLLYGMLAMALLAALVWDSMFPDRTDQEIVGVLPVRPRTLAAGRLAAALAAAALFAAMINVPSGLIFAVAQSALPITGSLPRLLMAHLLTTMSASMFVFIALMSLRGVLAISAGERAAGRVAVGLQLLTVISFVEAFMFLPGVLMSLSRQLGAGVSGTTPIPLLWFAGLYGWVAEGDPKWSTLAAVALAATATVTVLLISVSLLPAEWIGRRVLETTVRQRAGGLMGLARTAARLTITSPPIRGMFLFAVASLMRSRRHALVLATYVGLAVATGVVKLLSASITHQVIVREPSVYMLTMPMVCLFFAVFGLRAVVAIPTDIDANWPFRLATPTVRHAISVSRRLLILLAVLPIVLVWLVVTLTLWRSFDAFMTSAFVLASGTALVELALANWTKVPFAAAHEPASVTMRSRWPLFVFFLHAYGFLQPEAQLRALVAPNGPWWYLGIVGGLLLVLRLKREWTLRLQTSTLDAVDPDGIETLNLSEAAH